MYDYGQIALEMRMSSCKLNKLVNLWHYTRDVKNSTYCCFVWHVTLIVEMPTITNSLPCTVRSCKQRVSWILLNLRVRVSHHLELRVSHSIGPYQADDALASIDDYLLKIDDESRPNEINKHVSIYYTMG